MAKKTKTKKSTKEDYVLLVKYGNKSSPNVSGPYTKEHAIEQAASYEQSGYAATIHKLDKGQKVKVTVDLSE